MLVATLSYSVHRALALNGNISSRYNAATHRKCLACGKGSININSLDYGEVLLLLKTKKVASCSLSGHGS